jgi:hypothetical protein
MKNENGEAINYCHKGKCGILDPKSTCEDWEMNKSEIPNVTWHERRKRGQTRFIVERKGDKKELIKNIPCEMSDCDKIFGSIESMHRHCQDVHGMGPPKRERKFRSLGYECYECLPHKKGKSCGMTFETYEDLSEHKKKVKHYVAPDVRKVRKVRNVPNAPNGKKVVYASSNEKLRDSKNPSDVRKNMSFYDSDTSSG